MNRSTYSPLLQYPLVICHHPASIQTAVVVAGGGNSSSISATYQIHTCKLQCTCERGICLRGPIRRIL